MDESRKAFEQYAAGRLGLPIEMISDARNGDRYIHAFDSMSVMQPINGWWTLWQASRSAIEIELPEAELVYSTATDTYGEDGCLMLPVETISKVLNDAGIKVKE